jgi:hypothetical protein
MARKHFDVDKLPPGPELDAVVAEKVMGWKDLKRQSDRYWGRKPDRAGRWRRAAVDDFSCEPGASYRLDERMRDLGVFERYQKELAKISHAQNLPSDWASPDQRCRAAIKAVTPSPLSRSSRKR